MQRFSFRSTVACSCFAFFLSSLLPGAAFAEDEPELGWASTAELGLIATSGNAESTNLGLKAQLVRTWESARFVLDAGGIRVETTSFDRRAEPVAGGGFRVIEDEDTEVSAESYLLRGRYERNWTESLFWFAGAGWERNEFAGFTDRTSLVAGVGKIWFDTEVSSFRTDLGLTYTTQDDVIENPAIDDSFAGIRFSWDYGRQLTETARFGSLLIVDGNFDETSDYRADFTNSLAVTMSERLALKLGLQLLYDNEPGLEAIPLVAPDGMPLGSTVAVPLDDLDSILSATVVVSF